MIQPGGAVITLRRVADPASIGPDWRALEAVGSGSFFQSWTWVGCLAAERFDDAVLLRAERDGATVALALCNRRPTRLAPQTLWLGESGAAWDSVFVEHNGPLLAAGESALLAPCLRALLRQPLPGSPNGWTRRVILAGVGDDVLEDAAKLGMACHVKQTRCAPFVDLAAVPPGGYLATLGPSTRYQIRRSQRLYAAFGPLRLTRAASVPEGLSFLDRLAALHRASWTRRGQPGAFSAPEMLGFHRALVTAGLPRGEIDLLRVAAGEHEVGFLYNFVWRGRAYAYQSGFEYGLGPQYKPGLTCHHLAIEAYLARGLAVYDFLAGEARYKTSLASDVARLHWLELIRPASPRGLAAWLRARRLGRGAAASRFRITTT